jgi:tetratricopeptide (TPR) repeat protein
MINSLKLPKLESLEVSSYEDYKSLEPIANQIYFSVQNTQEKLLKEAQDKDSFSFQGYCRVCNSSAQFLIDYRHSHPVQGTKIPNWRERLLCPTCRLNNRMRSVIHLFLEECEPTQNSHIYLTEQVTPLYKYVKNHFFNVMGSEYLGNQIPYGSVLENGTRNESLTALSFKDSDFDFILSFDVLEHIPDYQKAFAECYRVLNNNGKMLFTVPFRKQSEKNLIRAKLDSQGNLIHLEKPLYHGDPLNNKGILCFQEFGWQILDELKDVGFGEVKAIIYGSSFYGYLGAGNIAFIAQKKKSSNQAKDNILIAAAYNYNLGRNHALQNQFDQAVEAYKNAIEINPNNASFYHSLGDAYFELKKWDEAISSYKKAIDLNPNFSWSYYNLGRSFVHKGELDAAISAYKKNNKYRSKISSML